MKLYLSSVGIPNSKELLSLLPESNPKVAIVANAWDVYSAERRNAEIESLLNVMQQLAITPTMIDLKTVTGEALKDSLLQNSLVWFMGGNSFYLNYLVHKSGLNNFITELVNSGLVYGGESAGVALAGTTLHGVELLDDPQQAPETIWEGLNLVDFGVVPHWGMEKYAESLQQCKREMNKYTAHVKIIANGQAIIVVNEKVRIVEK